MSGIIAFITRKSNIYKIFTDKAVEGELVDIKHDYITKSRSYNHGFHTNTIETVEFTIKINDNDIIIKKFQGNSGVFNSYKIGQRLKFFKGITYPINEDIQSEYVLCIFCGKINRAETCCCSKCGHSFSIKKDSQTEFQ